MMRQIFRFGIKAMLWGSFFVLVLLSGITIVLWPTVQEIDEELTKDVREHLSLKKTHPGWSFPGTLYSASASLKLPKNRRIKHAKLRNYTNQCPATVPGSYCQTTGNVIPRGGIFPEGIQPPGLEGWTRDVAMEPIELGPLIGGDAEIRFHADLHTVPPYLIAALLHSEDAEFYNHSGVNFMAFGRAIIANIRGGGYAQGASTITMQVVRNLTQERNKTIKRKLREVLQALLLERLLSKDEILQMYLDMPYLGQDGSYSISGFSAASQFYFQKDIQDLSINESAILVGILPAPAAFRPDKFPDRAQEKRDRVLRLLQQAGWNVQDALNSPIPIFSVSPLGQFKYPAFAQASISWLEDNFGKQQLYTTGLKVFTSLDIVAQSETERVFSEKLQLFMKTLGLPKSPSMQAASVLIDPKTGYLEAVYGGTIDSPYDFSRATQARRQSGSSFKPVVYAMAFSEKNDDGSLKWRAFDTVPNQRRTFPNTNGWRPRNNGGKYSPTSTLAKGLALSENIATASLLEKLGGPSKLIEFSHDMGFKTSHYPVEMGLALGQAEVTPLEMGCFVAMLANGGTQVHGQPVTHAIDQNGQNHVYVTGLGGRLLSEEAATLTRAIMRLVILQGTGGASRYANGEKGYTGNAFGKTGTTDNNKDLWFIGSSPTYSGALWIGYDKPLNMRASSSDLAAPLWGWWMRSVHNGLTLEKDFNGVSLKKRYVCGVSGQYRNATCSTMPIPALPSQKPKGVCKHFHPKLDPNKKKYENLWKRRSR